MIPIFEIDRFPTFDREQNGFLSEDAWEHGNSPDPSNDEFGYWQEVTGTALDRLLEWETRELTRLDRESASPEDFEENASDLDSDAGDLDWDGTGLSQVLDFGIVSCVAALNFLGAPTTSSCRGHYGSQLRREVPYVRFIGDLDESTWTLVQTLEKETGCQLLGCDNGLVELIGSSCAQLLDFARSARRARLS